MGRSMASRGRFSYVSGSFNAKSREKRCSFACLHLVEALGGEHAAQSRAFGGVEVVVKENVAAEGGAYFKVNYPPRAP